MFIERREEIDGFIVRDASIRSTIIIRGGWLIELQRRALPQIASNIRSIEIDSSIWLESMKLHQSFATSNVNWKHPVEIATVNEVSALKGRDEGPS